MTTTASCSPSGSGFSGVTSQLPSSPTIAVPTTSSSIISSTVSPGTAPPPLNTGWVSSVISPLLIGPVIGPTSSSTSPITGFAGAVRSTIKPIGSDGSLALPAGSVITTTALCWPSASGFSGVTAHLPSAPTTAVPTTLSSMISSTVSPGVPFSPRNTGSVSSVVSPSLIGPTTGPTSSSTSPITGFSGGVRSTTKSIGSDGSLALPAGSVMTTTASCSPSGSGFSGVTSQLPSSPTIAVPTTSSSTISSTVSPGFAPPPRKTGWASSVASPLWIGPVIGPTSSSTSPIVGLPGPVGGGEITSPLSPPSLPPRLWRIMEPMPIAAPIAANAPSASKAGENAVPATARPSRLAIAPAPSACAEDSPSSRKAASWSSSPSVAMYSCH